MALVIHLDEFEATVRIESGSKIKAFFGPIVPRSLSSWLAMDEDATTNWL